MSLSEISKENCVEIPNYLTTPYYRTLLPINHIGYDEEPDFNYGPYNVFCMETRLYPYVYKLLNRDVELIFKTIHKNNKMELVIKVVEITNTIRDVVSNKEIVLTSNQKQKLQDKLEKILATNPDYCLIDRDELYIAGRGDYPKSWYNEVLSYVNLDNNYRKSTSDPRTMYNNPTDPRLTHNNNNDPVPSEPINYYDSYNMFINEDGIYLKFNPVSDYKTAYNQVVGKILDTLDKYYADGVVYGASNIAYDWKLERMDNNEVVPRLYKPTWKDSRFASNLAMFLKDRIGGNQYIKIKVSDNLVDRHYISLRLSTEGVTMIFDGNYIKIPVKDLDEAQYVTSLVLSSQNKNPGGKVVTYATTRPSWIYFYMEAASKLFDQPSMTGYQTSDPEKPFMFSCIVDNNLSTVAVLNELESLVWTRIKEIDTKKEGDPHDLIINSQNN